MTDPEQRLQQTPNEANDESNNAPKQKSPWEQFNLAQLSTAALMEIFDFNEQDLMSNRNGFATRGQRSFLGDTLRGDADSMWQMVTILLIPAAVVAIILATQGIPLLYLVIGAGLMLGGMLAYAYRRQTGTRQDAENLRMRSAQGEMHISPAGIRIGEATVHVGAEKFYVPTAIAKALTEYAPGSMVRVYYAANSRQILSAEVLREVRADKLKVEDLQEDPQSDLILEAERIEEEQQRRG